MDRKLSFKPQNQEIASESDDRSAVIKNIRRPPVIHLVQHAVSHK